MCGGGAVEEGRDQEGPELPQVVLQQRQIDGSMRSRATIYHLAGRTAAAAEAALAIDWLGREGKQGRGGDKG